MKADEFMKATGATHRQLDYWTRKGINLANKEAPGSGFHRDYNEAYIPRVRLLVKLSTVLYGHITVDTLYDVFTQYNAGFIYLNNESPKLILAWEVEDGEQYRRINATPDKGPITTAQRECSLWGCGLG